MWKLVLVLLLSVIAEEEMGWTVIGRYGVLTAAAVLQIARSSGMAALMI